MSKCTKNQRAKVIYLAESVVSLIMEIRRKRNLAEMKRLIEKYYIYDDLYGLAGKAKSPRCKISSVGTLKSVAFFEFEKEGSYVRDYLKLSEVDFLKAINRLAQQRERLRKVSGFQTCEIEVYSEILDRAINANKLGIEVGKSKRCYFPIYPKK